MRGGGRKDGSSSSITGPEPLLRVCENSVPTKTETTKPQPAEAALRPSAGEKDPSQEIWRWGRGSGKSGRLLPRFWVGDVVRERGAGAHLVPIETFLDSPLCLDGMVSMERTTLTL